MSQKRLPKWHQHFLKNDITIFFLPKSSKFCVFYTIRFYSNLTSIQSKYFKKCMERLYTSNVSVTNSNIKCSIGKSIFAVNLPLKLFRATISNADTGSLKSLHALFDIHLDRMLAKFESTCMVLSVQNLELHAKNKKRR